MTNALATVVAIQQRLIQAQRHLRDCETDALTLPAEIDTLAIPTLTRALNDAQHAISTAFYTLAALHDSIREQVDQ